MMVEVENLVRRYGSNVAVNGVSFGVERGEVVGLLGPNGAGKSTIMRILAGYLAPTSGKAVIAGYDVFRESLAARAQIGYLPEGMSLYPEMRVEEYLLYRARIKGVPRRACGGRVGYVLDRCRITDVRRKLIGTLSKGYRQRVGLADALVHDPPVLILDEPTVGLDPNQIRQVRGLIRELGEDRTIVLSTHVLSEVEVTCGRVLIMHGGRLVYGGTLGRVGGDVDVRAEVVIELEAPAESAAGHLRTLPGVLDVAVEGEGDGGFARLRIVAGDEDVRERVGRCAAGQGWAVRELRGARPSLEEIFVRLTAGEDG